MRREGAVTREEVVAGIDRALERLELSNSIEPGGTPTDTAERGAILALEYLRSELA